MDPKKIKKESKDLTTIQKPELSTKDRAYLLYLGLGDKRSLMKVRRELVKKSIKISLVSLGKWCKKGNWVERVKKADKEITDNLEKGLIKQFTLKTSEILEVVKEVKDRYLEALKTSKSIPTAHDFQKMWEIQRKERGLDQTGAEVTPTTIYNVEINQRILNVVKKAEDEAEKIIREKIENEPEEK